MNTKTFKSLLLTAFCLLMAAPSMQADFWNSLKKAAKSGQEVLDQLSGTQTNKNKSNNNKNTTSSQSTSKELGVMPGLDIKLHSAERWGDGVRIIYSVTNNTGQDHSFEFGIYGPGEYVFNYDPIIMDDNNNKYYGGPTSLGNAKFTRGGGCSLFATIPDGITVRGIYTVDNVPRTVNNFKILTIGFCETVAWKKTPYKYEWHNVPFSERKNTNGDNILCTLPTLDIKYQGLKRVGNDLSLDFILTNNTGEDIYPRPFFLGGETTTYSYDGDNYDVEWHVGGKEIDFNSKAIPNGIAVKCSLLIKNVPTSVTGFSLVRWEFDSYYKLEFKNIDVTE